MASRGAGWATLAHRGERTARRHGAWAGRLRRSICSAQGRADPNFNDRNSGLVAALEKKHPGVASMEMESFTLLHLANSAPAIRAATCAIVAANRLTGDVVDVDVFNKTELAAGRAVLDAITSVAP